MNFSNHVVIGEVSEGPTKLEARGEGTTLVSLRIGVNRSRKNREGVVNKKVTYYDVSAWGEVGEALLKTTRTGDHIVMQVEENQNQDGVKVNWYWKALQFQSGISNARLAALKARLFTHFPPEKKALAEKIWVELVGEKS